jgi:DNA helicase INO80
MRALPYWGNVNDRKTLRRFWNPKKLYSKDSHFHILITSYQLVVADEKYFQRIKWQYMILDEAQAIKSSSSVRWKTLLSFNCRNRLLLTGTPIQNSMQELWALLHFIMPGLFDSHDEFSDWFSRDIESHAVAAEAKTGNSTLNEHQLQRLHMILKPFMLRRIKKDVENELGAKIEIDVDCSLSGRQRAMYRALRDKLPLDELLQMSSPAAAAAASADNLMNIVMQFRKVCNHPELFERTEIRAPFVLHELGSIKPTGRDDATALYWDGPLRSPLALRIPRIIAPASDRKMYHFLEFSGSIFHPAYVGMRQWDSDDPFAVTRFSSITNRNDIPKLLHMGTIGFAKSVEERRELLVDTWGEYFEGGNLWLPWTRPELFCLDQIIPDSFRFICRNSVFYAPRAISSPASLVVDDMNFMLRSQVDAGDLFLPRPPHFTLELDLDGSSGRYIVMPNLGKLVTDAGKMMALDRLLSELKAGGHRVLIYNQMTRMIDLMEEYLHYRGYTYIRLDGSSKIADRRDLVSDWQHRSDIFAFLLSTRAGGLGINLTAADTVIFYDSDWNPTVDQQAMDRAHRLGQTKQVTVYRLITRNSIEERMRQRAKQKDEIHNLVISGGEFRQMDSRPNQKDIVSLLLEEEQDEGDRTAENGKVASRKRMRLD